MTNQGGHVYKWVQEVRSPHVWTFDIFIFLIHSTLNIVNHSKAFWTCADDSKSIIYKKNNWINNK